MISVVIPVYGCNTTLIELHYQLTETFREINSDYEIIFVNDKGPNDAWSTICGLANKNASVKGINLSRNFGQHYAITAGLRYSSGQWVVVMDCDLQDQPYEIKNLFKKALEGYDVVLAKRVSRNNRYFKILGSKLFYKVFSYLTETNQNAEVANFGIYNKKVIHAILSMHDHIKYFPVMVNWVGFKQTAIEVNHASRTEGESSYNFKRLLHLAMNTILSFSDKPLRLTIKFGAFISILAVFYALYVVIKYSLGLIELQGYASLIISIWFLSGIIITVLGMVGLYIGKTFEQVKKRPNFIIDETLNLTND